MGHSPIRIDHPPVGLKGVKGMIQGRCRPFWDTGWSVLTSNLKWDEGRSRLHWIRRKEVEDIEDSKSSPLTVNCAEEEREGQRERVVQWMEWRETNLLWVFDGHSLFLLLLLTWSKYQFVAILSIGRRGDWRMDRRRMMMCHIGKRSVFRRMKENKDVSRPLPIVSRNVFLWEDESESHATKELSHSMNGRMRFFFEQHLWNVSEMQNSLGRVAKPLPSMVLFLLLTSSSPYYPFWLLN